MKHVLIINADALDIVSGKFYYDDQSSIHLTVNKVKATSLTDEKLSKVKNDIIEKVRQLLSMLTKDDGTFDKSAKIVTISPEYRIPLLIISTTISKLVSMGIKKDTDPCKSSFILEIAELNNYWLSEEEAFDIISSLKSLFGIIDSSAVHLF